MNLQRFVLPATFAAACHAVLLYGFVREPTTIVPKQGPLPIGPIETWVDLVEPPLIKNPDKDQSVTPLSGGTPHPELPDIVQSPKPDDFTVQHEPAEIVKVPIETIGPKGPVGEINIDGPTTRIPGIIIATFLDQPPRAKVQMPPEYPTSMKNDGRDGTVLVEFDVDVKGRVVSARVRESTDRAFE